MAQVTMRHAGSMQMRTSSTLADGLLVAVSRFLARRRTEKELSRLDDRMLADIGLTRGDIEIAAAKATGTPTARPPLWLRVIDGARTARSRARTIRELERLPDHVLADIGIGRWEIEEVADAIVAQRPSKRPTEGAARVPARAHVSPALELLARVETAVWPLRRWQISRIAAGQMARLNRETLTDLGYVKGDLDWVPEAMAERGAKRPANRNETRAGVA